MGWSSGSQLAEEVWDEIKIYVPEKELHPVAAKIYDLFCDHDADDWSSHPEALWSFACPDEYKAYVQEHAEDNDISYDEMLEKMKDWY